MAIQRSRILVMPLIDIIVLAVLIWTISSVSYLIHRHTERAIIKQRIEEYNKHSKKHDNDIFNHNEYRDNIK